MTSNIFRIEKNPEYGRYMVANRDIKEGELILKECPVLIGSQVNGALHCFKCCNIIKYSKFNFCPNCNVALLCKDSCKGEFHKKTECSHFQNIKLHREYIIENPQIIFPLRCLLLKECDRGVFEKIMTMEPHLEKRRNTLIWRKHKVSVEDILENYQLINQNDIQSEIVQKVCGILDVNTFEVRAPLASSSGLINPEIHCIRGLYPGAAMMAHNCTSNVHLSVDDNYLMSIHACIDIKQNEPILFNYANVLQGTFERQEHLQEGKYFTCSCKRCRDPSEFGTELSSLRCHRCRKGLIRFSGDEADRKWKCDVCANCFKSDLIQITVDEGKRRLEEVDPTDIRQMETLYKKLILTFNPNHYIMVELKQNMVGLYSKLPPSTNNLNRKIDLCGRLLSVFTKLEPGISRIRALTMYELQTAMVDLSNKQYREKEINEDLLVEQLSTAETILKEAIRYLLYEPPKSPEGRLAQMALSQLKMLRESIKNIRQSIAVEENSRNETSKRLKDKLMKSKIQMEGNSTKQDQSKCENNDVQRNIDDGMKKKRKHKHKSKK